MSLITLGIPSLTCPRLMYQLARTFWPFRAYLHQPVLSRENLRILARAGTFLRAEVGLSDLLDISTLRSVYIADYQIVLYTRHDFCFTPWLTLKHDATPFLKIFTQGRPPRSNKDKDPSHTVSTWAEVACCLQLQAGLSVVLSQAGQTYIKMWQNVRQNLRSKCVFSKVSLQPVAGVLGRWSSTRGLTLSDYYEKWSCICSRSEWGWSGQGFWVASPAK